MVAHDWRLDAPQRRVAGERPHRDPGRVEDDVELVRDGHAATGGDQRLRLDGLVAVSGKQQRRADPRPLP
jgi:hypothetical protein